WAGALRHRDTLGSVQDILPGDVNWMTAGRGIAHSERTPPEPRAQGHAVHGMQTWVALPKPDEEVAPSFHHHPASTLPAREHAGARLRVIAGRGFGMESPVKVFADTFNVAVDLEPDAELAIEAEAVERALYLLEGEAQLDGADIPDKHLLVLDRGARHVLPAKTPRKPILFGGDPQEDAAEGDAVRRRTAGCAAAHVVELRVVVEGAHRAGQGRLGRRRVRADPGRRRGADPAAGPLRTQAPVGAPGVARAGHGWPAAANRSRTRSLSGWPCPAP